MEGRGQIYQSPAYLNKERAGPIGGDIWQRNRINDGRVKLILASAFVATSYFRQLFISRNAPLPFSDLVNMQMHSIRLVSVKTESYRQLLALIPASYTKQINKKRHLGQCWSSSCVPFVWIAANAVYWTLIWSKSIVKIRDIVILKSWSDDSTNFPKAFFDVKILPDVLIITCFVTWPTLQLQCTRNPCAKSRVICFFFSPVKIILFYYLIFLLMK